MAEAVELELKPLLNNKQISKEETLNDFLALYLNKALLNLVIETAYQLYVVRTGLGSPATPKVSETHPFSS